MMKTWLGTLRSKLFLTVAIGLTAALHPANADERAVRIAVEGQFPPFNYLDSNGNLQGFDVEIAMALCQAMQEQCEFVVQDWEGIIPGLLDHRYDAIVSSMSMSAERREKVAFTQHYYNSPSVFLVTKHSEQRSFTPDDLAGKTLGVGKATTQHAYAQDRYDSATIVFFNSSPELYNGLAEGEVDIILEDKLAAYDWLTNTKAGQCCEFRGDDIKDPAYFGDGAGIAVRKEDEHLRDALNSALARITEDGTYDMINAKYFPFRIR